jgi:hypothetical protein
MPRRPRDPNQLAKLIVDMATGRAPRDEERAVDPTKNPHAFALGRLGGSKGGKARAKSLSATKRRAIARKAAKARWRGSRSIS